MYDFCKIGVIVHLFACARVCVHLGAHACWAWALSYVHILILWLSNYFLDFFLLNDFVMLYLYFLCLCFHE